MCKHAARKMHIFNCQGQTLSLRTDVLHGRALPPAPSQLSTAGKELPVGVLERFPAATAADSRTDTGPCAPEAPGSDEQSGTSGDLAEGLVSEGSGSGSLLDAEPRGRRRRRRSKSPPLLNSESLEVHPLLGTPALYVSKSALAMQASRFWQEICCTCARSRGANCRQRISGGIEGFAV